MALDIIIMASGFYMVYWAVQMKMSKQIPEMLVGKGFKISSAKDPEGFIRATFPYTFGAGVLLVVFGLVGALDILALYPLASTGVSLLVVIIILWYGSILMKAQRKYLVGLDDKPKKK